MNYNPYEIINLDPNGILAEFDIVSGDRLLSVNGRPVRDELDIRYADAEEQLFVEIEKSDGEIWELEIEKDSEESLGISCDGETLGIRRCRNNCIFCFIDQMPEGMRETLYVKDDDERLSFLQGNYVTLTNLTEDLKQRIVDYRIMPMNISIHTTDADLRCKMLGNRFAGSILEDLRFFSENGILMNGQIVVCPGINDGAHLQKTLDDLTAFYPQLHSVSVVPVGLTKFREGLYPLEAVSSEKAEAILKILDGIQEQMLSLHGTRFVFPGDELILSAGRPLPDADAYEIFEQIENGVGMMTDFEQTLDDALLSVEENKSTMSQKKIAVITGMLAADFMRRCAQKIMTRYSAVEIEVLPVVNRFFGEQITVSGLVTGKDILEQMDQSSHFDLVLIPENMVRYHTDVFLDDITLSEIEEICHAPVRLVAVDGGAFLNAVIR